MYDPFGWERERHIKREHRAFLRGLLQGMGCAWFGHAIGLLPTSMESADWSRVITWACLAAALLVIGFIIPRE